MYRWPRIDWKTRVANGVNDDDDDALETPWARCLISRAWYWTVWHRETLRIDPRMWQRQRIVASVVSHPVKQHDVDSSRSWMLLLMMIHHEKMIWVAVEYEDWCCGCCCCLHEWNAIVHRRTKRHWAESERLCRCWKEGDQNGRFLHNDDDCCYCYCSWVEIEMNCVADSCALLVLGPKETAPKWTWCCLPNSASNNWNWKAPWICCSTKSSSCCSPLLGQLSRRNQLWMLVPSWDWQWQWYCRCLLDLTWSPNGTKGVYLYCTLTRRRWSSVPWGQDSWIGFSCLAWRIWGEKMSSRFPAIYVVPQEWRAGGRSIKTKISETHTFWTNSARKDLSHEQNHEEKDCSRSVLVQIYGVVYHQPHTTPFVL